MNVGIVDNGSPAAIYSGGTAGTARRQSDQRTVVIHEVNLMQSEQFGDGVNHE